MTLEPDDFPLIAEDTRVYSRRNPAEQILVAIDAEMATELARRLNMTADLVDIPHIDLRTASVEQLGHFFGTQAK